MDDDDFSDDAGEEWDESDNLSDDFCTDCYGEMAQEDHSEFLASQPCSSLKNSLKSLHHHSLYSTIFYVREFADVLLHGGPTRYQGNMWPMGNPIHRSFDDCQLASQRRGAFGQAWASTLRKAHKDDDYYRHRRPQDMLYPFDNSLRAFFFYYPYQHLDDFEDDHGDFLDYLEMLKQRKEAEKAHKKRHQKRGKKRKGTKDKTAAPPSKSNQPGHFAQYEDTDFDEEMDCC